MTTSSDSHPHHPHNHINGTVHASRIPRSVTSTLNDKKTTLSKDETISPASRKITKLAVRDQNGVHGFARVRRTPSRTLLNFPAPPSSTITSTQTNGTGKRPQEIYLILNPRDDKCERRVVLVPQQPLAPVRVGRVINPAKGPAKFDNLLFDTKVLSRNHAEVYGDAQGRVFIRDLGSSNGTYINSFRLSPDAVPSEPFPILAGQELALGIDIREETNQDNIAYHRVWFTVEHVGPMSPPPPEAPTPSTLGAVDLDPWIPKPTTREIVDHLVQEINAAKAIAEEITSVQAVLDGMMEGEKGETGVVERVQRELEEKSRRVEELEGLLGMEREERRALEERIRRMEDERAAVVSAVVMGDELSDAEEETLAEKEEPSARLSPITILAIPNGEMDEKAATEAAAHTDDDKEPIDEPPIPLIVTTPPGSPSTAPSSPLHNPSTRSISPISSESSLPINTTAQPSHPDALVLLEKIATLESELAAANEQIEHFKSTLSKESPILEAVTSAVDFPFTFTAPSTGSAPTTPRRSPGRRVGSVRRRRAPLPSIEDRVAAKGVERNEFYEGLYAAVGVVVLGWMGMWFVNHLVERGQKAVK